MRKNFTCLLPTLMLCLSACGSVAEEPPVPENVERDRAGNALTITSVGSIANTRWLYASYGVPGGGKFSSYGKPSRQRNAFLIDRETGETLQLLPDNEGFVHETWFIRAVAGELRSRENYGEGSKRTSEPPAFVMLETERVTDETSERMLLVG